tara:strand:- start:91 stop:465 length:375 start_codon:yes stop_codon:yes gene_type:complete
MEMNEVVFNKESKWEYAGRNKNGKPRFRRPTNQTLAYVKKYLDKKGITYLVEESATMIFIYKDKDPKGRQYSKYAYYYTTGRWGDDSRKKHYHSAGIEDFINTYYKPNVYPVIKPDGGDNNEHS